MKSFLKVEEEAVNGRMRISSLVRKHNSHK
jgi:hypothetical protein